MIHKHYELNKVDIKKFKFILFYGKNEGLKNETLKSIINKDNEVLIYDEKEILDNSLILLEDISSNSLFIKNRTIIIKRATDKLIKIIDKIKDNELENITIVVSADNLEKRSKLRYLFEKEKDHICVAFYPDNEQTLAKLTYDFLKQKKISISQANINLIINKCNGDRENLFNELKKIEFYTKNGKKITSENLAKLTNLIENHSISELVDNCLIKNKKKIMNILNENNFNNDDCILIIRTFLNKSKKILKLSIEYKFNKNMDLTISSAKPPIFWKEKEITKQQILMWRPENIKKLIYQLNTMEFIIKKNINNSINFITDFILEKSSININN
jgi:DNA polymerase-3 subunit delta